MGIKDLFDSAFDRAFSKFDEGFEAADEAFDSLEDADFSSQSISGTGYSISVTSKGGKVNVEVEADPERSTVTVNKERLKL